MSAPTFCTGVGDIAARYRGFVVDQWGVLHDGGSPYPGAIDCLGRLRDARKRVVLLSNVAQTVASNRARLQAMGFDDALFDAVVTSGEATRRALASPPDAFFETLGERCLLWTRGGDRSIIEGLPIAIVESADDATFVLLAGTDDGATLDDFEPGLRAALGRGLPMVCANPDVVVVGPNGLAMAPGAVAQRYRALGGRVAFTGKPHPPIYRACFEALAPLEPDDIVAIGDSVEHDIAGGAGVGLDTVLIMGGIHANAFDLDGGRSANWPALERLTRDVGATPRWVLPRFRWQAS